MQNRLPTSRMKQICSGKPLTSDYIERWSRDQEAKTLIALSVLINAHAIKLFQQFQHIVEGLIIHLLFIFRQMLLIVRDDPLF